MLTRSDAEEGLQYPLLHYTSVEAKGWHRCHLFPPLIVSIGTHCLVDDFVPVAAVNFLKSYVRMQPIVTEANALRDGVNLEALWLPSIAAPTIKEVLSAGKIDALNDSVLHFVKSVEPSKLQLVSS